MGAGARDPGRAAARALGAGGGAAGPAAAAALGGLRAALRGDGAAAALFYEPGEGSFQAVAAALLRGLAVGALAELPAKDRGRLAGELFAGAPAGEALLALAGAQAPPRPAPLLRPGSGGCARAAVVAELLLARFGPGAPGVVELVSSARDGAQAGEWARALTTVAEGWAGPVPDPAMPSAFAALSAEAMAGALAAGSGAEASEALATGYFERLCRRGHARAAARAAVGAAASAPAGGLAALGRAVAGLRGSLSSERFAEALLAVTAARGRAGAGPASGRALEQLLGAAGDCPLTAALRGPLLQGERALPAGSLRALLAWLEPSSPAAWGPDAPSRRAEALGALAARWCAPALASATPQQQRHVTRALEWALGAVPEAEWGGEVLADLLPAVGEKFGSGTARVQRHGRRVARALAAAVAPGRPLDLPGDGASSEEEDGGEGAGVCEEESGEEGAAGGVLTLPPGAGTGAREGRAGSTGSAEWDPDEPVDPYGELRALPGGAEEPGEEALSWPGDPGGTPPESGSFSEDSDDEPPYEPYDLREGGDSDSGPRPAHLGALVRALRPPPGGGAGRGPGPGDQGSDLAALAQVDEMVAQASRREVALFAPDLCSALLALDLPRGEERGPAGLEDQRRAALAAVLARAPPEAAGRLAEAFFSVHLEAYRRGLVLEAVAQAAEQLAGRGLAGTPALAEEPTPAPKDAPGAGGKTRVFAPRSLEALKEPPGGMPPPRGSALGPAARHFVLAFLRGAEGGGRSVGAEAAALDDFRMLGHLVVTLGSVVGLLRWSPEAPPLALRLLDFVLDQGLLRHPEAFVRRAALACGAVLVQAASPALVGGGLVSAASHGAAGTRGSGGLSIAAALYRRIDRLYEDARGSGEEDADPEVRALAGTLVASVGRLAEGMQLSAALGGGDGDAAGAPGGWGTMSARLEQLAALRLDELRLPARGGGGPAEGGGGVRLPDFSGI